MTIEAFIIKHLNEELGGVNAHGLVPPDKPDTFVVLERTGGSIENFLHHSMFVTDCYAKTLEQACILSEQVIAAMQRLPLKGRVTNVSVNSAYNDTDTETHEYRYGVLFDITHR